MLDVEFKVFELDEKGRSKTDLDNLLKILLDVLSVNMVNGQGPKPGLGIVSNDAHFYEIHCKKIPVTSEKEEELSLIISVFS
jgi:Holliday junction resolvase RusA-like endonuclease